LAASFATAVAQTVSSPELTGPLVSDLVAANRILFDQGVVDGFGHVSVRSDSNPARFLLSRSMAPALVTAADILEVEIDSCTPVDKQRTTYLERFIHCEIYKGNPGVKAVAHSHSPALIPFGISSVPLRPVYHMSSFLGAGAPVFEIRETGGDQTDMLIRNQPLGQALAKKLGDSAVVLMRGHGATVVGNSLQQAVFRAVYAEVNARLEAEALRLGPATFLNESEAAKASATNDSQIGRAWELWKMKAMGVAQTK
jgi:ribulose-5-phosphate 4-epimerase/fuculose-1-phosphate aldolase